MISIPEISTHANARYLGRKVYHFRRIHSTNLELLDGDNADYISGDIVRADEQISGLGRYRRHWVSDYGGLYFSILFEDVEDPAGFYRLVILCALAVLENAAEVIKDDSQLAIKWPNDIYYGQKKLSGILVQSKSTGNLSRVVVGIGINLNNALPRASELRNPAISLASILQSPIDTEDFFNKLVTRIDRMYHEFMQGRFPQHLDKLNSRLYSKNKEQKFQIGKKIHTIIPRHFESDGKLAALVAGKEQRMSIGEFI